jgi:hypothetical protein
MQVILSRGVVRRSSPAWGRFDESVLDDIYGQNLTMVKKTSKNMCFMAFGAFKSANFILNCLIKFLPELLRYNLAPNMYICLYVIGNYFLNIQPKWGFVKSAPVRRRQPEVGHKSLLGGPAARRRSSSFCGAGVNKGLWPGLPDGMLSNQCSKFG